MSPTQASSQAAASKIAMHITRTGNTATVRNPVCNHTKNNLFSIGEQEKKKLKVKYMGALLYHARMRM
jgi:hypothetical protein